MRFVLFSLIFLSPSLLSAQGTQADYARAFGLNAKYGGKVFRDAFQPFWQADSRHFWYRVQTGPARFEYWLVDSANGKSERLFDPQELTATLKEIGEGEFSLNDVPPRQIRLSEDREKLFIPLKNETAVWNRKDHALELGKKEPPRKDPENRRNSQRNRNPEEPKNNPWRAYKDGDKLILQDQKSKEKFVLATDSKDYYYSGPFLWSSDFKKLVAVKVQPGASHIVTIVESSPRNQVQPKVRTAEYLKPGDRVTIEKPRLFDLESKQEIPIDEKLFENPYEIKNIRWEEDGSRFTFEFNQRGHQVYRVLAVDAKTGAVKPIVEELPKTFFDYAQKCYIYWCAKKPELLWMSERSGWNHIYRIDSRTGEVLNAVTAGDWVVRRVEAVDEEKRQIWLQVGGIDPKQDPYYVHHIRVNFDGTGLVRLTEGDGTHRVTYSPDKKYLFDRWSRVDKAPVTELRDGETGKLICVLQEADDSALRKAGWQPPERFVAKGRDGKTDIYGVIYRPSNFDPAKKYAVIENIYAGPQDSFVPKAFRPIDQKREYAELGFIVVQIDGMGTSNRSKAFHDVCWKNLADAGFPDRILWLKAAAAQHPEMDLSRVGIFGGSAGGQNAMRALIDHGDFYKVAVADCGCHDNRMDKIWWNELWMSWPVGKQYEESSNVVQAYKLKGKLLLTVGELDSNVDPASTMQVVNALIKANKDFDMIVVPGANHGAGESPYMNRRRMDYFVRNLLGVEPPPR